MKNYSSKKSSRFLTIAVLVVVCVFVYWAYIFISSASFIASDGKRYFSLFDDGMISMRYAWNLSHGNGLVWNSGERIEGITNLFFAVIMSIFTLFLPKVLAVLSVQILGVITTIGIGLTSMKIAEQVYKDYSATTKMWLSLLVLGTSLFYYPLSYWSLMGMEVGFVSLLLLLAVLLVIRKHTYVTVYALPVLLGIAFMTRPDTLVQGILIFGYFLVTTPYKKLRVIILSGGILALFIAVTSLFRVWYYGSIVPNTYVLKMTGLPLPIRLENGWGFIEYYLQSAWLPLSLSLVGLFLRIRLLTIFLFLLPVSSIAYQVYVGGDPWPYWRMMAPMTPLLLILSLDAIVRITSLLPLRHKFSQLSITTTAILCVLLYMNTAFLPELFLYSEPYQKEYNLTNVNTAIALEQILKPGASIGVFWAGTIPYYSGFRAIDLLGKSDIHVAKRKPFINKSELIYGMSSIPGHNKSDLTYSIVGLRPTFTQGVKWMNDDVYNKAPTYATLEYDGLPLVLDTASKEVYWSKLQR